MRMYFSSNNGTSKRSVLFHKLCCNRCINLPQTIGIRERKRYRLSPNYSQPLTLPDFKRYPAVVLCSPLCSTQGFNGAIVGELVIIPAQWHVDPKIFLTR